MTADLSIGIDGRVESVTVVEGHSAHRASATAALKQYRFAPILADGKPAQVIVRIGIHVPDTLSTESLLKKGAGGSVIVGANRAVVLAADCSRAMMPRDGSEDAIRICRSAVDAANQLTPEGSYQRRASHGNLGQAYINAKRWRDAIAVYEAALMIPVNSDGDGFRAAEYLGMIAFARMNLGDLPGADGAAASSVATLESLKPAAPDGAQIPDWAAADDSRAARLVTGSRGRMRRVLRRPGHAA